MPDRFQSRWNPRIAPASLPEKEHHPNYFLRVEQTVPSAVLVFHGIGEQVRFETLSSAASLILQEAAERGATEFSVVIRPVPSDADLDKLIVRSELGWKQKDGKQREVHVYEAYWAPLTAGKVSYLETMGFLLSAGWNGMRGTVFSGRVGSFRRWLFGGFKELKTTLATFFLLPLLMAMIGCIAAGIAIAASALAGLLKQLGGDQPASVYKVLDFVYGQIAQPWNGLMGWIESICNRPGAAAAKLNPDLSWAYAGQGVFVLLVWVLLVSLALYFKGVLSQYVGSLVAYLSPYKDSKWEELRSDIQQVGMDAANVVLNGHTFTEWIPKYGNIVFVAHSLGSVIGYDTLNGMINLQAAKLPAGAPNPAVDRIRALITLGSPLDKTAFLFRVQLDLSRNKIDREGELRETMVCAVQPLITSYPQYRHEPGPPRKRPKWINIWSPMDIVSGRLDYYDDPCVKPDDPKHVQNMIDPEARVPFYAHLQYWNNKLLRQQVYNELF